MPLSILWLDVIIRVIVFALNIFRKEEEGNLGDNSSELENSF